MKLYEDRTGSTPVTSSENSDDFSSTVPSVVSHLFFFFISGFSYRPCSLVLLPCPLHCQIPCCSPMFEGSRSEQNADRVGRMLHMDGMKWDGVNPGNRGKTVTKNKNTEQMRNPCHKTPESFSLCAAKISIKRY